MRKLQIVSIVVLIITLVGMILWHFVIPFPDWLVRVIGTFMILSIFTTVFSTKRIGINKK